MFPEGKWWIFSKAEAKSSIKAQSKGWWHSAEPWLLNIVNVVHWFAFPVGAQHTDLSATVTECMQQHMQVHWLCVQQ